MKPIDVPRDADLQAHRDGVTEQIRKLDDVARRLGEEHDVEFDRGIDLEPYTKGELEAAAGGLTVWGVLTIIAHTSRRVSLEKIGGTWGLFYARTNAEHNYGRAPKTVRLQDAPLEMRERFLARADEFFTKYMALVGEATERRRGQVDKMAETRQAGQEALSKWGAVASKKTPSK